MSKPRVFYRPLLTAVVVCLFYNACTCSIFAYSKQELGTIINLAGKQRMLTQKMSKEILLIASGVDADSNRASLQKTANLFAKTLKGLVDGDTDLGLPKTTDADILAQLDKVAKLWAEFKPLVDAVLAGTADKSVLEKVAAQNLPLLKNMNKAVQMYAKLSDSDLDPALATTINLAGKQRMLTQKMTKELLLIANEIDPEANRANLKKTVDLFGRTLKGLFDGDSELGLPGTKDAAIRAQLEIVQKLWADYKPVLEQADTSADGLAKAAKLNLPLLKEMNQAVKMYEKSVE